MGSMEQFRHLEENLNNFNTLSVGILPRMISDIKGSFSTEFEAAADELLVAIDNYTKAKKSNEKTLIEKHTETLLEKSEKFIKEQA